MSRHLLDQADPDLVVWPELPVNPSCGPESDFMDSVAGLAGKSRTPFLVNCMHHLEPGQGYYNAAQWVRADGFPGPRHKKKILLPLGEYLPLAETFPWLRRLFPEARRYRPGEGLVVMEADDRVRVAALLCYEAVFARTVRDHVRRGANLLVNMTDDAWFGDSDASTIHLALASFRAVEHRVPLVRVTNSGVGAHIRATGEVVPGSLTGLFTRATRTQEMYVPEHRAPYTRLGDSFLWLLVVYTGADILLRLDLTRRRRNGVPF
jgi:apolipoprotein N-acyltransferase